MTEDLFFPFFFSSLNFGQENGLGFELENFHSGLHYSQIFWPLPFENPAYATVGNPPKFLRLKSSFKGKSKLQYFGNVRKLKFGEVSLQIFQNF